MKTRQELEDFTPTDLGTNAWLREIALQLATLNEPAPKPTIESLKQLERPRNK